MVLNSVIMVRVAHVSAEAWQEVACLPERLSSSELLDLVFFIPLQELGRLALSLWNFLCLSPPETYSINYSSSSDEDDDDDDSSYQDYYYQPHSD